MKRILPLAFALSAAACSYMPSLSPHRMEIQQGNFVSQEMVNQLKPGMTKDQVRFAMGTALVADVFHADRWDYLFVRQRANSREVEHRRISVFFEQDKLVRIEGDVVAAGSTAAAASSTPAAASSTPAAASSTPAASAMPVTPATAGEAKPLRIAP